MNINLFLVKILLFNNLVYSLNNTICNKNIFFSNIKKKIIYTNTDFFNLLFLFF